MITGAHLFLFFDLAGEHAVERKVGSEPVVGASRVLGLRCGMIRHGGLLHTHTRGGRCAARVLVVVCSDLLGARARADLTCMVCL